MQKLYLTQDQKDRLTRTIVEMRTISESWKDGIPTYIPTIEEVEDEMTRLVLEDEEKAKKESSDNFTSLAAEYGFSVQFPTEDNEQDSGAFDEPETTFNEATGQWEAVQHCWKCDAIITDWSTAIEDDNGEVKCGDCHQNLIDQTHDAFAEMFGNPMAEVDNLTALQGQNGGQCTSQS